MAREQADHLPEELPGGTRRPGHAGPRANDTPTAEARPALLSPGAMPHLQRAAGNQAVAQLVAQRSQRIVVQRADSYPYGGPNQIPHIHKYGPNSHIKINDGAKTVRIDLVQNGKRYGDNVARAFKLARDSGNMTLVNAIKTAIRGTPFA